MKLSELLISDLERQYFYRGQPSRRPSLLGVFRSAFSPRFMPVVLYRISFALYRSRLLFLARAFSLLNFVLFGIEIAMRCRIGKGLYFPHTIGTVIGAEVIGDRAVIYHGVTIGAKEMDLGYTMDIRPIIGNDVVIGSGAKVLGGITVGNAATIGANSVVVKDVPENVVVGGIPARILRATD